MRNLFIVLLLSTILLMGCAPSGDRRTVLVPKTIGEHHALYLEMDPADDEERVGPLLPNVEPPTEQTPYTSSGRGLSFAVPFNSHWGTEEFRLNPYDEGFAEVAYGPLLGCAEVSGLCREAMLRFLPQQPLEQTLGQFQGRQVRIPGLRAGAYEIALPCQTTHLQIVGRLYNYDFSFTCLTADQPEWKTYIEDVVRTVEVMPE